MANSENYVSRLERIVRLVTDLFHSKRCYRSHP